MFWRLGLELDRRPVAATIWLNVVCRRPVRGSTRAGRGSRYVFSSLVSSRHSSTAGTMGCWSRRPLSTRASVEYPVLPLRAGSRPRRPNSTSASCCVEPMVKGSPASPWMRSDSSSTRSRTRAVISPRRYESMRTPAASMRASTPTSGSSISRKSRSTPCSRSRGRCCAATRQVSTARVAAAAWGSGPSTRASESSAPARANRPRCFSGRSGANR